MKKGFTIVELLIVIGVIAILTGLVTTAASSAMRQGRERRMTAMGQVLQAGVSAYYARCGYWPPKGGALDSAQDGDASDQKAGDLILLNEEESNEVFREVVKKSVQSSAAPYLDVSGLYVGTEGAANGGNGAGRDFRSAGKSGTKSGGGRQSAMALADMVFGYPDARSGHFRRYYVEYNTKGDSIRVLSYSDIYNNRGTVPYSTWWSRIKRFDAN